MTQINYTKTKYVPIVHNYAQTLTVTIHIVQQHNITCNFHSSYLYHIDPQLKHLANNNKHQKTSNVVESELEEDFSIHTTLIISVHKHPYYIIMVYVP